MFYKKSLLKSQINYVKSDIATRKGSFVRHHRKLEDDHNGNDCTRRYANSPNRTHVYNKNNRFGNHNSHSASDYCASAGNNYSMSNRIPDEDHYHHRRNRY